MTDPYNLSLIQNSTDFIVYPQAIHEWTGGQFGIWIVAATILIAFLVLRSEGVKKALVGASMTGSFIANLLFFMDMFPDKYINLVNVVLFATILIYMFTKE